MEVGLTSFEIDNNVVKGVSRLSPLARHRLSVSRAWSLSTKFDVDLSSAEMVILSPPARNNRRVPHHRDESVQRLVVWPGHQQWCQ